MVALCLPLISLGPTSGSAHSGLSHPKPVCLPARPWPDPRQTCNPVLATTPKVPGAVSLGQKQPCCPPSSSGPHCPGESQGPPVWQTPSAHSLPTLCLSLRTRLPLLPHDLHHNCPKGAWAEAGPQTCCVWLSTVLQKNLNRLPTSKSQISHKNPGFWLLWTNQKSLAALDPPP